MTDASNRDRSIGNIIRVSRRVRGLSMGDLARATKLTVVRISDIELGHALATDEELALISDAVEPERTALV